MKFSMGKKMGWFGYVKRLFIHDSKLQSEEKPKKWRWFFGRFKSRQCDATEVAKGTANEAAEEQRKHAMAVAIATAAAAEAAVAAANAAALVVRLSNFPHKLERRTLHFAAIRIQTAYRGHLARKALSALKGIVKIQAMVRGELVRSRVIRRLASLSLFSTQQPLVHQKRVPALFDYLDRVSDMVPGEALCQRKQEAIAIRESMRQHSFSNQERRNDRILQELMALKEDRKSSRWFDQYAAELEAHRHQETAKSMPFSHPNIATRDTTRLAHLKLRTARKQETIDESNSPFSLPRRSFCQAKQQTFVEDRSLPNSPVVPAYMAATESAKAKCRSISTPKQQLRSSDTYSDQHSPCKGSLSSWSSMNSETTNMNKRNSISH